MYNIPTPDVKRYDPFSFNFYEKMIVCFITFKYTGTLKIVPLPFFPFSAEPEVFWKWVCLVIPLHKRITGKHDGYQVFA